MPWHPKAILAVVGALALALLLPGSLREWAFHEDVRWLIAKEVGAMVIAGVAVGVPLAYALARLSESLLFGVKAGNPSAYVLGLGLIAAVALAACWIPARQATKVDPLVALRYE